MLSTRRKANTMLKHTKKQSRHHLEYAHISSFLRHIPIFANNAYKKLKSKSLEESLTKYDHNGYICTRKRNLAEKNCIKLVSCKRT